MESIGAANVSFVLKFRTRRGKKRKGKNISLKSARKRLDMSNSRKSTRDLRCKRYDCFIIMFPFLPAQRAAVVGEVWCILNVAYINKT